MLLRKEQTTQAYFYRGGLQATFKWPLALSGANALGPWSSTTISDAMPHRYLVGRTRDKTPKGLPTPS